MSEDYQIVHRGPQFEEDGTTVRLDRVGSPADQVFPTDVTRFPKKYGGIHERTFEQLHAARNDPGAVVQVYRAVPHGVNTINPGDWVALSPEYAAAENVVTGGVVISANVKAADLWSEGLVEEWGYQGTSAVISNEAEQSAYSDLHHRTSEEAARKAGPQMSDLTAQALAKLCQGTPPAAAVSSSASIAASATEPHMTKTSGRARS